jgi:hypothetical protein
LVEVMANDGGQVESEAPVGWVAPAVRAWIAPSGTEYRQDVVVVGSEDVDGFWAVEVLLSEELMMRVDIHPEAA